MSKNDKDSLIVKFVENDISDEEFVELKIWLQEKENKKYFDDFLTINYLINKKRIYSPELSLNILKERILKFEAKRKRNRMRVISIAASLVALISISLVFKKLSVHKDINDSKTAIIAIRPGSDKATLTLEDGKVLALEKGQEYNTKQLHSTGKEITYTGTDVQNKSSKPVYNILSIPRGGQFVLNLADGTRVWLNSETQIKFPVQFIKGETRQVELVYGEAYFDVSPSSKHSGAKFKVVKNNFEIEVIGTEFNIKAYKDENHISTTLVEGVINVDYQNKHFKLKPNNELALIPNANKITIRENIEVYDIVSWKEGKFSFQKKTLQEIMLILSRWYDIDVKFKNKTLVNKGFNGLFEKSQGIEDILETFKKLGAISKYTIKDKTVVLE